MREIKFRAWDKSRKCWVEDFSYQNGSWWIDEYRNDTLESRRPFEDIKLMQFTGLYDKNNKEIYEGDIIKFWEENFIEPITYSGCTFIAGKNGTGVPVDSLDCEKSVEVIGNIYENPELI